MVTALLPSMSLCSWGDLDGERYRDAYFGAYPGVWRHGDWIAMTGRGTVIMRGRSDFTLNRRGVRLGSAEIYQALDRVREFDRRTGRGVDEPDGGCWMPLFVAGVSTPPAAGAGQGWHSHPRLAPARAGRNRCD
ncbi:hypothetical protein [Actinomadura fulvescens]|uniref:Uncharacterized protein n=1 Tax=Actinomadura fulvescens TaxID=46160 RepID=A0ABP6CI72_9ACTN